MTKLTHLQGRVTAVLIGSVLFAILVGSWTPAGAATASAQFCGDSAKLQGWIAQNEQPGLDQYDYDGYPDLGVIQPEANYLEKLSAEAPQSTQPAFSEWANFAKAVADTTAKAVAEKAAAPPGLTSWPALASQDQQATFAAGLVEEWMQKDSGCKQLYVTEHDPPVSTSKGGHGINPLWFVGGAILFLIVLGAIFGSRGGGQPVPTYSSSAANDSSSTKRRQTFEPEYSAPKKPKDCRCVSSGYGRGRLQCHGCSGTGTRETFHQGIGNTQDVCTVCNRMRSVVCPTCGGSGQIW